jgi:hypothetical protein
MDTVTREWDLGGTYLFEGLHVPVAPRKRAAVEVVAEIAQARCGLVQVERVVQVRTEVAAELLDQLPPASAASTYVPLSAEAASQS